jgi:murein DD-endopeptidase MepM/ murein hydrolase activator NlpD
MIRPVKQFSAITTHFRDSPDPGVFGVHAGNDYACAVGTPVYAPISGRVTVSMDGAVAGGQVEITGDMVHRTLHMSRRDVSAGQTVTEGQQIGLSGNTGTKTTGPHCHWDVRKLGTAWDHSINDYFDSEVLLKEGKDMPLTKEQIMVIYELAFDDNDVDVPADIISAYTGKDVDGLLTHLHQDPSWLAHKAAVNSGSISRSMALTYINANLK